MNDYFSTWEPDYLFDELVRFQYLERAVFLCERNTSLPVMSTMSFETRMAKETRYIASWCEKWLSRAQSSGWAGFNLPVMKDFWRDRVDGSDQDFVDLNYAIGKVGASEEEG